MITQLANSIWFVVLVLQLSYIAGTVPTKYLNQKINKENGSIIIIMFRTKYVNAK